MSFNPSEFSTYIDVIMTYEKNWAQSLDNYHPFTSITDSGQYTLWIIKSMLLGQTGGFTSGLWTTYYSCNGVTAGTPGDGVDRWGSTYTPANIGTGSWYVLKSPLMNGYNFYLLLAPYTLPYSSVILFSKSPFTSGTTSVLPSSTDSWYSPGTEIVPSYAMSNSLRYNMILSSTGDFVFWEYKVASGTSSLAPVFSLMCVAPIGCSSNDQYPIYTFLNFNDNPPPGALNNLMISASSPANYCMMPTLETLGHNIISSPYANVSTYYYKDSTSGASQSWPCYVTAAVGSFWGVRGRLPDILFAGNSSNLASAVVRDSSGSIIYSLVGLLWLPLTSMPNCN